MSETLTQKQSPQAFENVGPPKLRLKDGTTQRRDDLTTPSQAAATKSEHFLHFIDQFCTSHQDHSC
jgi:hypothetical protein